MGDITGVILLIGILAVPISGIIIGTIVGDKIDNMRNEKQKYEYYRTHSDDDMTVGSCIFAVIFIISIIIGAWVVFSGLDRIKKAETNYDWVVVAKENIIAIKDTTGIEGKFRGGGMFISRGYIKENWQYVFYIKQGSNIKMMEARADVSNIIEDSNREPSYTRYRKQVKPYRIGLIEVNSHMLDDIYCDIVVPEGTVLEEYRLDLEK